MNIDKDELYNELEKLKDDTQVLEKQITGVNKQISQLMEKLNYNPERERAKIFEKFLRRIKKLIHIGQITDQHFGWNKDGRTLKIWHAATWAAYCNSYDKPYKIVNEEVVKMAFAELADQKTTDLTTINYSNDEGERMIKKGFRIENADNHYLLADTFNCPIS